MGLPHRTPLAFTRGFDGELTKDPGRPGQNPEVEGRSVEGQPDPQLPDLSLRERAEEVRQPRGPAAAGDGVPTPGWGRSQPVLSGYPQPRQSVQGPGATMLDLGWLERPLERSR